MFPKLSKVGTPVGTIVATDLDEDRLYYRLESPMVCPKQVLNIFWKES